MSEVAFFFLFFVHGTSIGNGQQGFSYNIKRLCDAWLMRKVFSATYCKTAVISWLRLVKRKAKYEALNEKN